MVGPCSAAGVIQYLLHKVLSEFADGLLYWRGGTCSSIT